MHNIFNVFKYTYHIIKIKMDNRIYEYNFNLYARIIFEWCICILLYNIIRKKNMLNILIYMIYKKFSYLYIKLKILFIFTI